MNLWPFKRKATILREVTPKNNSTFDIDGWHIPLSAEQLLKTELRQKYLGVLWQQVSMTKKMFTTLYQKPIERYAEIVQLLPASESHHHSHLGGMLDHGLEVVSFAAKLRQNYVLPQNAAPEEQSRQRDAWTAIVIYSALVHDIGKVIVDIEIQLQDGSRWLAWHGIPKLPYKFKYIKSRDYNLHPTLGGFLASQLIPNDVFDWLSQYPEAFTAFMYTIAGHYDKAGILSEIIQKADQHSVTLALGGDIKKLVQQPTKSFSKQLILALRYLLEHKIKLNTPKGPADGWYTEDGLWLMSKTTADNIRAYLLGQGISVPSDNLKLFDELQSLGIIDPTPKNTAIWHCRIKANSGWTPPNTFTLLKIKPEVIWEHIDDRPSYFAGTVYIKEKKSPVIEAENEKENKIAIGKPEVTTPAEQAFTTAKISSASESSQVPQESHSSDLNSFVLDLFSSEQTINNDMPSEDGSSKESPPFPANSITTKNKLEKETDSNKISRSKMLPTESNAENFIQWLKSGIQTDKFAINKPTAKLHIIDEQLFMVTPSIFQLFLQEAGMLYDQESVTALQYDFQALRFHKKRPLPDKQDSVNFWKCSVIGPRKSSYLIGYLIPDIRSFFGDKVLLNNQRLILLDS
ncbi:integrating conjugative element relaxase, PFL_4751 family [Pasteurella testudinis DSM 23072]|uniref:Integrating conjugative element relaxase, PFL_4751 family n=1 Tax=Pasteurella testudinis DSM 23072 TaxID=1122938 RepID=A0A1W1UVS6_9PAST|nr:MobH family relaxase [Pasteurella testudinis]SMB85268.1 integrating conjugative element relaxase, PFL_4751 family [Pasteurella testudinis DSM 23072]SUB52151.1 integrating conjugative element relaxase, PFGI-1 class [Pasteurella testudinis]